MTARALVPGGAAALAGIAGLAAAGFMLEAGGRDWAWAPAGTFVLAVACFALAGVQARRARPSRQRRPAPTSRELRATLAVFVAGFLAFGVLGAYGAYLLHQRDTGPHVAVTVTRCELVDPGPRSDASAHDYCYGTWTYAGREYVDKYVQGAGPGDEGHAIDATVHGDTAYSRDLETPLILLGLFGTASALLLVLAITTWRRLRRAR